MEFGRLRVVKCTGVAKAGKRGTTWLCWCMCGKFRNVPGLHLKRGHTQSCGCMHNEQLAKMNTTHGGSHLAEYRIWYQMRERCRRQTNVAFKHYGGRGIKVCERWDKSFADFLFDMGRRPAREYSLDRIDVNGNYEPGNCRWATRIVQANNKRPRKDAQRFFVAYPCLCRLRPLRTGEPLKRLGCWLHKNAYIEVSLEVFKATKRFPPQFNPQTEAIQ